MNAQVGRLGRIVGIAVLALAVNGCGYSLAGRGSFLPDYIETIGVPLFENVTPVFEVEQVFTERVRTEFIGRGKYRVVPEMVGVDAVLSGRITSVGLNPVSFTGQQQAARYELRVTAALEFRDVRVDEVLWENPSLLFIEEYAVTTGSGVLDPQAFFGQDLTALDRVAENFAKAVVTAILEAF